MGPAVLAELARRQHLSLRSGGSRPVRISSAWPALAVLADGGGCTLSSATGIHLSSACRGRLRGCYVATLREDRWGILHIVGTATVVGRGRGERAASSSRYGEV